MIRWLLNRLRNLPTAHHRLMQRYLVKRGWVVFYLNPRARNCSPGECWLKLWESEMRVRP